VIIEVASELNKIEPILEDAYNNGYNNAISEGILSAERIFMWFASNHKLKEPKSIEELSDWSHKEIERLKSKMK
jgi:hypothetical protein